MEPPTAHHQLQDPKVLALMIVGGVTAYLVVVGDKVAFLRPPNNIFEKIVGAPTEMAYMVFGDRLYANITSGVIFAALLGFTIFNVYSLIERKFFKPRQVNNMLNDSYLEEALIEKAKKKRDQG